MGLGRRERHLMVGNGSTEPLLKGRTRLLSRPLLALRWPAGQEVEEEALGSGHRPSTIYISAIPMFSIFSVTDHAAGWIFWLILKKFVGSYLRFSFVRRG